MDLVCNIIGLEDTFINLEWNGRRGFEVSNSKYQSGAKDWYVNNSIAGTWQTSRNLTYVVLYNTSHMVFNSFTMAPVDAQMQTLSIMNTMMGINDGSASFSKVAASPLPGLPNAPVFDSHDVKASSFYWGLAVMSLIPLGFLFTFGMKHLRKKAAFKRNTNVVNPFEWSTVPDNELETDY
jgi:Serine carboxypeptidase